MVNLDEELKKFKKIVAADILEGFNSLARSAQLKNNINAYDFMVHNLRSMEKAAHTYDVDSFYYFQNCYYALYKRLNIEVALDHYRYTLAAFIRKGYSVEDSEYQATAHLWNKGPRLKKWLPVKVQMHYKDLNFFLVGHKMHAIEGTPYVTLDEVKYLKNSGVDILSYLMRRKSLPKQLT